MRSPRTLVLVLAGTVALLGSSCGDDEGQGIPSAEARDLVRDLQEVNRRSRAGVCDDLRQETFPRMEGRLEALPDDLDQGLRDALADGFGHLRELVDEECKQKKEEEQPDPEPTPTPQVPTPTPPTPQPAPEPKPKNDDKKDEEPKPDDGGGGDGGGNGGDGGGGGVDGPPPGTETGPGRPGESTPAAAGAAA